MTAPRAVRLVLVRPDQQTASQPQTVQQLQAAHPEWHPAVTLLERFARLIRRQTEQPAGQELA